VVPSIRHYLVEIRPNPMPESVTDRPTKAHEYLFLLSKGPRYFYDADAIREGASENTHTRRADGAMTAGQIERADPASSPAQFNGNGGFADFVDSGRRNRRSVWTVATQPFPGAHFATFPPKLIEPCVLAGSATGDVVLDPFAGAGTTGVVSRMHDRRFIGIELNPAYAEMARERIRLAEPQGWQESLDMGL
jgi:hypothetical protein